MPIPRGTEVYNVDDDPIVARGMAFTQDELDNIKATRLISILTDESGRQDLAEFFANLNLTEFHQENIANALKQIPEEDHSKGWREGEAIAEVWLTDHKNCEFPWPFNRDLRHPRASLPGAELVGFSGDNQDVRFVFGQVKTSKEAQSPPQVVHKGDKCLINQVLQLHDDRNIKKTLVNYLIIRAMRDNTILDRAKIATVRWLESSFMDIVIFGILVRDVAHSRDDLMIASRTLCRSCHSLTRIEFWALYLPTGSIPEGPQHRARQRRKKK